MAWEKTAEDATTWVQSNVSPVLGTGARTVFFKVKTDYTSAHGKGVYLGGWGANTAGNAYRWRISHENSYLLRVECSSGYAMGTRTGLNDGKWHYIAIAHQEGANIVDAIIYIDGLLDPTSLTLSRAINTTGSYKFAIGLDPSTRSSGELGIPCLQEDYAIYNRALTAGEMIALTSGRISPADITRGRVLYWPLRGNYKDHGAFGHHGTINGVNYQWSAGPRDRSLNDDLLIGSTYPVIGIEEGPPFGYSDWWFTNQRQTFMLRDRRNANLKR